MKTNKLFSANFFKKKKKTKEGVQQWFAQKKDKLTLGVPRIQIFVTRPSSSPSLFAGRSCFTINSTGNPFSATNGGRVRKLTT
jgi:hypothetical protein